MNAALSSVVPSPEAPKESTLMTLLLKVRVPVGPDVSGGSDKTGAAAQQDKGPRSAATARSEMAAVPRLSMMIIGTTAWEVFENGIGKNGAFDTCLRE